MVVREILLPPRENRKYILPIVSEITKRRCTGADWVTTWEWNIANRLVIQAV